MSCSCWSRIRSLREKITRLEALIKKLEDLILQGEAVYDSLKDVPSVMDSTIISGKTYDEGSLSSCLSTINSAVSTCGTLIGKCRQKIGECHEEISKINDHHNRFHVEDDDDKPSSVDRSGRGGGR